MLDEGESAKADENHTCYDVGRFFGNGDATFAQKPAQQRNHEGDQPDDDNGDNNVAGGVVEAETDAHHKGIDAGGNAQEAHDTETGDIEMLVLVVGMKGLPHHPATDKKKQEESNPMVDRLDIGPKSLAQEGTQKREQPLEEAEGDSHQQPPTEGHLALERARGGDHQAVDTEGQGDEERF